MPDLKPGIRRRLAGLRLVPTRESAIVANLLPARAAVREKELAVRAALGAGRQRLIRQLLTESTLLAFCGGGLGLALAVWGGNALKLISPSGQDAVPHLDEVSLDWRVLGFTLGVA